VWIRRAVVTGTLVVALAGVGVDVGAGAAMAQSPARDSRDSCAMVAAGTSHAQSAVDRIDRKLQRLSARGLGNGDGHRRAQLEARRAKAEQLLQNLQASCKA